jgi:hypothetical protein
MSYTPKTMVTPCVSCVNHTSTGVNDFIICPSHSQTSNPVRCSIDEPEEEKSLLRMALPRSLSHLRPSKPVRTKLIGVPVSYIGAAASTLTFNSTVVFNSTNFPEIASFSVLYDQVRVLKVHHDFTPYCSISSTNYSVSYGSMALFPDADLPAISTSYGCLEAECNSGLMLLPGSTAANNTQIPKVKLSMALKPTATVGAATTPGSSWFDLNSAPTIYQLQGVFSPLSAVGCVTILSWNWLEVEFRSRV